MRIIYVLPKQAYFAQGRCGSVSHAIGVADSLAVRGIDVTVLSGPEAAAHLQQATVVEVEQGQHGSWHSAMFKALDNLLEASSEPTVVIVRYGVSNAFRFVSRMRLRRPAIMWCFEVNSLGYHQNPTMPALIRRLMLFVETRIVGQADCSYLISDVLQRDIQPRVPARHRCLVVPNGGPPAIELSQPKQDAAFRFVFFGMLQRYNHMDVMIHGFLHARAAGLDAELHVHGDGPLLEQVEELSKKDTNIYAHGRFDFESLRANELSQPGCALLLPFGESNGLNRVQSPIKLFEYMSTGLPIIASDMPQIRLTLSREESAILVNPTSVEAWGDAMRKLKSSATLYEIMSREISEMYPAYTWERRTAQLYDGLTEHFRSRVA